MKKGNVSIAVACAILAFIVTLQLKSVGFNTVRTDAASARTENLQTLLYTEQDKNETLFNELLKYREELERLQAAIEQPGGEDKLIAERIANLELLSGVSAVTGPGITIVIENVVKPAGTEPSGNSAPAYEINHSDILDVINTLWTADAESIAINGQRLVANSSFASEGSAILIDKTPFSSPFVIQAVGDPEALEAALFARQGVAETLAQWGIKMTAVKAETIKIPAYKGRITFEYAKAQ